MAYAGFSTDKNLFTYSKITDFHQTFVA